MLRVKITIVIIIFVAKVECPQSPDTQRKLTNFHALRCMHQSLIQMFFSQPFSIGYPSNSVVILFVSEDTPESPVFY